MRKLIMVTATVLLLGLGGWTRVGATEVQAKTVWIVGQERFVPNALFASTFRFYPGRITVPRGTEVTWVNTTEAPHTVTLVDEDDLPTTIPELFTCEPCAEALAGHNLASPNPVPVLPPGDTALNQVGDSRLIAPKDRITATVRAPAGSELYYLCAIHPWMQGEIEVE